MRLAVLLALAVAGCAGAKPKPWVPAEGRFVAQASGFELVGPAGWMRRNAPAGAETFIATRDGTPLQRILAGSTEEGKPIGFGKSTRPLATGMSPAEVSELVIDGISSSESLTDVKVLESSPARLDGREGFHVLVAFKETGLSRRAAVYGAVGSGRLYWLLFVAPERHYFPLDLPTFEQVVSTLRIRAQPRATPAAVPPSS
jgi:hypothetical protein